MRVVEQAGASSPGRRALVAALVALVALALAVGVLLAPGGGRGSGSAPPAGTPATSHRVPSPMVLGRPPLAGPSGPPSPSATAAGATSSAAAASSADVDRTAAVRTVLAHYAEAMRRRDKAAFAATLDPSAHAFRTAQLTMFADAARVPFASYAFDVAPSDVAAAVELSPSRLLVAVDLRYALRGFDSQPTDLRKYFTFTMRPTGWLLAGDQDGASRSEHSATDLWDHGPVVVVRGARSLVLAHPASRALARTLAATADAAVPRVTAFWGTGWARTVVILVPSTEKELAAVVGTSEDLSQIAALATAEVSSDGSGRTAVGDRIAINPATFGELGPLGRQVVVTHEVTHVATRAVTGADSPTWLVEGIADYVGFKGTPTSVRFDAAELAHEVDEGDLPKALPSAKDFAGGSSDLSLDYEESWLACRFIVARTDEATLKAFYRRLGTADGSPAQALREAWADVLHTDQATFTTAWRQYVAASLK